MCFFEFFFTMSSLPPFFAWDVSTILFFILCFFFLIMVFDKFFLAKKRSDNQYFPKGRIARIKAIFYFLGFLKFNNLEKEKGKPFLIRWALSFYPVILLVFVIRSFMFEPFQIPSNSMMPTLLTGDFILVNKWTYGLRLPVTNTKILSINEPKRGDVLVFRYPNYEGNKSRAGKDFIKRVIGIPGDKIVYKNEQLFVNGVKATYKNKGIYTGVESGDWLTGYTLLNEKTAEKNHDILVIPKKHSKDVSITVPKNKYFVMGDNRLNSADSRYWGFVPEEFIIGKAFLIWFHFDKSLKFNRLGFFD